MTSASMPETKSEKPKSPPSPSSGAAFSSAPPVSQPMSPSRRAMNPSTLMPRKTDPVKEASMADTLPDRYDDSAAHLHRGGIGKPDDGVAGLLELVVGHADDDPPGQRAAEVGHQPGGRRRVQMCGRLVQQDDVPVGQQCPGRGQPAPLAARQRGAAGAHRGVEALGQPGE